MRRFFEICGSFLLFVFRVRLCHTVLSVPCSLVVTCRERADLLGHLCVMFPCVFVTFPAGVLVQVWYLIVLVPDLCLLPYFISPSKFVYFDENLHCQHGHLLDVTCSRRKCYVMCGHNIIYNIQ